MRHDQRPRRRVLRSAGALALATAACRLAAQTPEKVSPRRLRGLGALPRQRALIRASPHLGNAIRGVQRRSAHANDASFVITWPTSDSHDPATIGSR
jgi:hypothetical protein